MLCPGICRRPPSEVLMPVPGFSLPSVYVLLQSQQVCAGSLYDTASCGKQLQWSMRKKLWSVHITTTLEGCGPVIRAHDFHAKGLCVQSLAFTMKNTLVSRCWERPLESHSPSEGSPDFGGLRHIWKSKVLLWVYKIPISQKQYWWCCETTTPHPKQWQNLHTPKPTEGNPPTNNSKMHQKPNLQFIYFWRDRWPRGCLKVLWYHNWDLRRPQCWVTRRDSFTCHSKP